MSGAASEPGLRRLALNGTFMYRKLNHLNINESVIIAV